MLVLIISFAMFYIGSGVVLYVVMKDRVRWAYERGKRAQYEEIADGIQQRVTGKYRPSMILPTMPNFGEPTLKIYSPAEFTIPLVCTSCKSGLLTGDAYYEIPIANGPKGSVTAVHLKCEREVKLG